LNEGIDGILGMGPHPDNGPSFIHELKAENKISQTIASFSLGYSNGDNINQNSYMIFGGVNHDQFVDDMYEFGIVNDKWWALPFNELTYSNKIYDRFLPTSEYAFGVVDTGTSMLAVPEYYFNLLVADWES
jgi:hypothetical protein